MLITGLNDQAHRHGHSRRSGLGIFTIVLGTTCDAGYTSDSNLLFAESSERDDEPEFYRALWPPSQSESQTSNQIHRALVIEEKSGLASRLGDKIRAFNRPKLR